MNNTRGPVVKALTFWREEEKSKPVKALACSASKGRSRYRGGVMNLGRLQRWGGGAWGTEFAKACGMKQDGDCRELLAEVQGEERLRFGEPNHEG